MLSPAQLDIIEAEFFRVFGARPKGIYLVGSQADGTATAVSDIDVFIEADLPLGPLTRFSPQGFEFFKAINPGVVPPDITGIGPGPTEAFIGGPNSEARDDRSALRLKAASANAEAEMTEGRILIEVLGTAHGGQFYPSPVLSCVDLQGPRVTIGSQPGEPPVVILDHPTVSRRHVVAEFDAGQWTVRDLDSDNGTLALAEPQNGEQSAFASSDWHVGCCRILESRLESRQTFLLGEVAVRLTPV